MIFTLYYYYYGILCLSRMGTHPSGPSKVAHDGSLLMDWLADKPQTVGVVPEEYPANNLPFLFKVLSVRTALSVQVTAIPENAEV